ncbi:MAG TPA: phytanoyl-CoA dioxygenase family protein [Candidatus Aquilonibacter sp.]
MIDCPALDRDGYVFCARLLDLNRDIAPLQRELGLLIRRAAEACGTTYDLPDDPADFDRGYCELVARIPQVQPLVYDMSKALPSFQRLIVNERIVDAFRTFRGTELCGTAFGTCGIRIDRPGDERHLAPWHQEFPYQFRSLDGMTFWIPLVPVDASGGPVVLARGSHREGPIGLDDTTGTADEDKARGEYGGWRVHDEETVLARYERAQFDTAPGDVLAFDFLTLHASAPNRSRRARWTAQIRYFNFADPYGASIGWAGGIKHGKSFAAMNEAIDTAATFALKR